MMKPIRKEAIRLLDNFFAKAERVTLVTHTHPDGDAVGCTVALMAFLKSVYRTDVRIVYPDPIAARLRFLTRGVRSVVASEEPQAARERLAETDLIVCLDCNGFSRVEGLKDILADSSARKVLIDHHLNPDAASFDLVFSETEISSTCELLFDILVSTSEAGGDASKLPMPVLRALLTGMTTDTNNFANSVFPSTFEMASRMLEAGVDRDGILAELYNRNRENRLRMTGHLLKDNMRIFPNGVSCIVVRRADIEEYDIREGETEGIVNMPLTLDKVRMSIFLREDEGFFRVSIRSKRGTSAFRLASTRFHGGGHEQAAGGRLYFPGDIADASMAEAFLERITDDYFKTEE